MKTILTLLSFSLIHLLFMNLWIEGVESRINRHVDDRIGPLRTLAFAEALLCASAGVLFSFKTSFFGVQLDGPIWVFLWAVVPGVVGFLAIPRLFFRKTLFAQANATALLCLAAGVVFSLRNPVFGFQLDYPNWVFLLSMAPAVISGIFLAGWLKNESRRPI